MLQQLDALSKLSGTRDMQRHQRAQDQLVEGMKLLQRAHDEGFTQPLRLQQACSLLIEAIKQRRGDIRPYLGLAYIFMLLEDHAQAQKYVRQALTLEPDNPLVRSFQARIAEDHQRIAARRQTLRHSPGPSAASIAAADQGLDYDALYETAQSEIRKLLRELMLAGLSAPVSNARGIAALEQRQAAQQAGHQAILAQLKIVDEDIDTADLVRLLKPVEAHLRRSQQVIELSKQLQSLAARLREDIELAAQICEEARGTQDPADLEVLEENLEALLDNADGYAQSIEELQQQHQQLADIETLYAQLQEQIESYQDALEEAQARLER
ncbi:MAG: hypothetical protein CVV27_15595 [Candidatus Melainabacteria bacterium HGW-Melainabacteria-1]|nr:MAG: hypothetical protein CVV27_15595 [Candidatus Melainabacteria bacterium HGW-Melainabacteria-1]